MTSASISGSARGRRPSCSVRAISGASKETIERHIANCTKADPAYGSGVAKALGIDVREKETA